MSGSRAQLMAVFFGLASAAGIVGGCGSPTHPAGMEVSSASACVTCHLANYNATTSPGFPGVPPHAATGFPQTCGDCHNTSTWLGALFGHVGAIETAFPITSGVHTGIACASCHDSTIAAGYTLTNANCTATCHTAANTEGYNGMDGTTADSSIANWEWPNTHNGSLASDFTTLNPSSSYALVQFCRNCHPSGQDAQATALVHNNPFATAAQFSANHQSGAGGSTGTCADCHTTSFDPVLPAPFPTGQRDYTQDVNCGANCHQHSGQRVGRDN